MKIQRRSVKRGRVEIIPMIDTILILLIFYMSFSSFKTKEKRIDAKLPLVTKHSTALQRPLDITLHVHDRSRIIVNQGETYNANDLRHVMTQLAMVGQEITVVISAEPGTDYQAVIAALDACALAKLKKVAFQPLSAPTALP